MSAGSELESSPPASDYESLDSFYIDDVDDDVVAGVWNLLVDPFADARPHPLPEFTGIPGLNPGYDDLPNFTACVDMFLTDKLLIPVVQWTNRRAECYFAQNLTKNGKIHGLKWRSLDLPELRKFLAYVLNMGLQSKPEIRLYWSQSPLMLTPWYKDTGMSHDRFLSILKFLRFADPRNLMANDRLKRIRPFLAEVQSIFKNNYQPNREICVDESLVLYKGCLLFKQYIKSKRARFGVKIFSACSSEGYMYNFEVYSGKGDQIFPTPADGDDLSMSERIVTHLVKDLLDMGYSVYTDNWYTSARLAEYLLHRDTLVTGTCRKDRGIPPLLQQQRLNQGQSVFARKDNLLAVKYQDKREVHLISTEHNAGFQERTRYKSSGSSQHLMQPRVIQQYSQYMQGVDKTDQLMHSYDCTRKSYCWFKKLGLHFIQRSLLNAHFVFKESTGSDMTFLTFLIHTINYLSAGETDVIRRLNANPMEHSLASRQQAPVRRVGRPARRPTVSAVHSLETFPSTATRARPQRRCVVCLARGIRKDSRYYCSSCPDKPALCISCFGKYSHQ